MFKKLKDRFGRRNTIASHNFDDKYIRCKKAILRVHHDAIIESGEDRETGLEDAVISPMALDGLCDRLEYCPNTYSRAALAIDYIANFHPFVEGNKRTAFQIALAILRKDGLEFKDDMQTYIFIKDVAAGKYNSEEIEEWLKHNTCISSP